MKIVQNREEYLSEVKAALSGEITAIELGVFNGEFSQMILDILNPKKLYLIDPFEIGKEKYGEEEAALPTAYSTETEYTTVFNKLMIPILEKRVVLSKKYSYDAVTSYPNNYFDFIYIDASHLYKDVKRDLNDWLPKLKIDGLMCLHDYVNIQNFGVIKAVDEFCQEHNFEMILFNENGGDVALRKKYENT
jgi:hypothetical protein